MTLQVGHVNTQSSEIEEAEAGEDLEESHGGVREEGGQEARRSAGGLGQLPQEGTPSAGCENAGGLEAGFGV